MRKKAFIVLGIIGAILVLTGIRFIVLQSASIGIIGGADGPTVVFVTGAFNWKWILLLAGVMILGIILGIRIKKSR